MSLGFLPCCCKPRGTCSLERWGASYMCRLSGEPKSPPSCHLWLAKQGSWFCMSISAELGKVYTLSILWQQISSRHITSTPPSSRSTCLAMKKSSQLLQKALVRAKKRQRCQIN